MSFHRENLEELRIIFFEIFAVHLKIVCVYYSFVTLLIGGKKDSYSILSYFIPSYPLSSWWNINRLMPAALSGGGVANSNMKLVYICRIGLKNVGGGGLDSGPSLKMGGGGLSERPLTGRTGDSGAKNNKETFFLF